MKYTPIPLKRLFLDDSAAVTLDADTWQVLADSIAKIREHRAREARTTPAASSRSDSPRR